MTDAELKYYIDNFYGYGSWESGFYYVGMEEGLGSGYPNLLVDNKVKTYAHQGLILGNSSYSKKDLIDNYGFQMTMMPPNLREARFFRIDPTADPQPTWMPFINMHLSLNHIIRPALEYQAVEWGSIRAAVPHAVIELYPLPASGLNDWRYDEWFPEPFEALGIRSKGDYWKELEHNRINHICKQIHKYKPKLVVLYGTSFETKYKKLIKCVTGEKLNDATYLDLNVPIGSGVGRAKYATKSWNKIQKTIFVVCSHPTPQRGNAKVFFENLTKSIRPII